MFLPEKLTGRKTKKQTCTLGCGIFFYFQAQASCKILIRRAFYSPRLGDFKTVFIFFIWDVYFSNILTSKFEEYFSNIVVWRIKRRVIKNWTQISNQFWTISENIWLTCEKPCFLENSRILQLFNYLSCLQNFQNIWEI